MSGGDRGGRSDTKLVGSESHQIDDDKNHHHHHSKRQSFRPASRAGLLLGVILVTCIILYRPGHPYWFSPSSDGIDHFLANDAVDDQYPAQAISSMGKGVVKLKEILEKAATADKTVIVTTLNAAWAAPNSILDLFLESFRVGNQTEKFLEHLIVITLDQKANDRCLALHPHCYPGSTNGKDFSDEAYFLSKSYLEILWKRIDILGSVLRLGYNFIFTDADILWFRDPFPYFYPDGDFQIACDYDFGGPTLVTNSPNGGFIYVKSNNYTINFYKFWYMSRLRYHRFHDQDVFNRIRNYPSFKKLGIKLRFLNTSYFDGFCQPEPRKDFNKVCTLHANCCFGLDRKVHDLKIMLEDWREFMSLSSEERATNPTSWRAPTVCKLPPKVLW